MVKMLVVGASGLLGHDVCLLLRDRYKMTGTYLDHPLDIEGVESKRLDISSEEGVKGCLEDVRPDVLLLCAAMTGVDACEDEPDLADELNNLAVERFVGHLDGTPTKLVCVSTDYVFDGGKGSPYVETDSTAPSSVYGRSKLLGERAALAREGALVVRVSSIWGPDPRAGRRSFASWVLQSLEEGKSIELFTDQRVTPTYTGSFARALPEMLERDLEGIYHLACADCMTRYESGQVLARVFDLDAGLISKTTLEGAGLKAQRPSNSCLDVSKLEAALGRDLGSYSDDVMEYRSRFLGGIGTS